MTHLYNFAGSVRSQFSVSPAVRPSLLHDGQRRLSQFGQQLPEASLGVDLVDVVLVTGHQVGQVETLVVLASVVEQTVEEEEDRPREQFLPQSTQ